MRETRRIIVLAVSCACGLAAWLALSADRSIAGHAVGGAPGAAHATSPDLATHLSQVLPAFDNRPLQEAVKISVGAPGQVRELVFYPARKDGKLVGYAAESYTLKGYGGRISLLAGLTPTGVIQAIVVIQQHETKGLGSLLTDRREAKGLGDAMHETGAAVVKPATLGPNKYLDQYNGKSVAAAARLRLRQDGGDLDGVTGATVTSRAIADAVQVLSEAFKKLASRPGTVTDQ